jgi:glutathione S-transferase
MSTMQIVGRRSSLFTRMPLIFAEQLAVPFELVPIHDMTALGPEVYAGNPALKLPILRNGDRVLFGAHNICRAIAERAIKPVPIVWPEQLRDGAGAAGCRHSYRQTFAREHLLRQSAYWAGGIAALARHTPGRSPAGSSGATRTQPVRSIVVLSHRASWLSWHGGSRAVFCPA